MLSKTIHSIFLTAVATGASLCLTGCSWVIEDDLAECPAELSVTFTYDRNIKFSDAFAAEVTSVNVWAFDPTGKLVWSGAESGEALKAKDFKLNTGLPEGSYDFISWCGLKDNSEFNLANYTPSSKEELEVKLKTIAEGSTNVSVNYLPGLYHGSTSGVVYTIDPNKPTYQSANISLTKDTKDIRVLMQHLDGSPIENRDFEVTITDANSWLSSTNEVIPGCPVVTYKPWNVRYGQVTAPDAKPGTKSVDTVASLLFDLSTSRLITNSGAILTVHRNWDDKDIIRIPLIDYLLLVKGYYGNISDQDYLDRQDDYSIVFFIDQNSNWYLADGIYINGWAVVPPQDNGF